MSCREMLSDIRSVGLLTQAEVAKELGVTQSNISKVERGVVKEMKASAYSALVDLRSKVIKRSGKGKPRLSQNRSATEAKP